MPGDQPQDVVGRIVTKALGGRSPEEWMPTVVPKEIKSPAELMGGEPKGHSVPGIVEKFVPIDAPKVVGDVGEDVYNFARSLTPQNIFAKGSIDLPEPKNLNEVIKAPHAFGSKELRLPAPSGLPQIPGIPMPPPPHELLGKLPGMK